MTKHYATFSGERYFDTTRRIVEDAPKFGADNVMVFDNWWLRNCRPAYWEKTKWLRKLPHPKEGRPRGIDWFCFKSFYILDAFRRIAPGDVLLATDADTYPIADLNPLYETCVRDGGVMVFGARGCLNRVWTKMDALKLMGANAEPYLSSYQAVARFVLFRKPTGAAGEFNAEQFLLDWLAYTSNPFINTFDPSILYPDQPELVEPRCEQSVLGILAIRHGLPLYREACEFGGWGTPADPNHEKEWPGARQTFVQFGGHSYRPGFREGNEGEGSAFRNVQD